MLSRLKRRLVEFNKAVTTRRAVDRYLSAHRLTGLTLNVGGRRDGIYRDCWEDAVVVDIAGDTPIDVRGDAHMLPLREGAVDSVLCTEVLEHLVQPARGADEMRRVLKPGGRLLLTTRFLFPIHDRPGDFFRFTKFGLQHLFRRWDVEEIVETDTSLETIDILLNRLWTERKLGGLFRVAVFSLSLFLIPLARLLSLFFRTDAVTTGYIVSAKKPT